MPLDASTERIILPSSAPSVSIFDETTTGGASVAADAGKAPSEGQRVKKTAAQIAEIKNGRILQHVVRG